MRLPVLTALILPLLLATGCSPQPGSDTPAPAAAPDLADVPEQPLALVEGRIYIPLAGRDVTAGFGRLAAGPDDVTLIGLAAPFAQAVEMHTHSMDAGGRMAMRQVDSFSIPGGQELALARGGDHLMFFGVSPDTLVAGQEVMLTAQVRGPDGETETVELALQVVEH